LFFIPFFVSFLMEQLFISQIFKDLLAVDEILSVWKAFLL